VSPGRQAVPLISGLESLSQLEVTDQRKR